MTALRPAVGRDERKHIERIAELYGKGAVRRSMSRYSSWRWRAKRWRQRGASLQGQAGVQGPLKVREEAVKVGFIGVGNMGGPMCRNIIKRSNHQVTVFDLNAAA